MATTSPLFGGSSSGSLLTSRHSNELLRLLQRRNAAQQRQQALLGQRPAPVQPSDLHKSFSGLRSALGALGPLQIPGLGALSGAAGIGSAITNPYMSNVQKALASAQGGAQIAGTAGQLAGGQVGNLAGTYLPYVGTALGLASILGSNAPDNVKWGQATQAVAAPAISAGVSSAASTVPLTATAAALGPAAIGGIWAALLGAAVEDLTAGDYAAHRQESAKVMNEWLPMAMDMLSTARSSEEIDRILGGDFGQGETTHLGKRFYFEPGVGFTGGYEAGAQNLPEYNRQFLDYANRLKAIHTDPVLSKTLLPTIQQQGLENVSRRWDRGDPFPNMRTTPEELSLDPDFSQFQQFPYSSPFDPGLREAAEKWMSEGVPMIYAYRNAYTDSIRDAYNAQQQSLADWLNGLGTASA